MFVSLDVIIQINLETSNKKNAFRKRTNSIDYLIIYNEICI